MTEDDRTIRAFCDLSERRRIWQEKVSWRGVQCMKPPSDLWLYAEAIWEIRPTTILELGTGAGGTALFMADVARLANPAALVITVDRIDCGLAHDSLVVLVGSTLDAGVIERIRELAAPPVLAVDDAEHTRQNVSGNLETYSDLVTPGSYFVVEDLGWPEERSEVRVVVDRFLEVHPEFVRDDGKSKFLQTVAPGGWLKRI